MKRWLKKHGKWLAIDLGVLFIANGILGIFIATDEWQLVVHACAITLWLGIILWASGVIEKFFSWWEKDRLNSRVILRRR